MTTLLFDSYTVVLLILREDAPKLNKEVEDALQDAHMDHLAKLHAAGHLLAAGPLLGEPDRKVRGLSILRVGPDEARALKEQDPAVRAGRYRIEVYPWMVPRGAIQFSPARFPHSMVEAEGP